MNVDTSKLNKVKLTVFTSNLANFVMITCVVLAWMSGQGLSNWVYFSCAAVTLVLAWFPVVSLGFFMYFLNFIGHTDLLTLCLVALPTALYVGVIVLFPNRVAVPSKL